MKSMLIAFSAVSIMCSSAFASSRVAVETRVYNESCGYWSATNADFNVHYSNSELPSGSRVFLHHGSNDWMHEGDVEMTAVAGSNWGVDITEQLVARGSSYHFDRLLFVIKIVRPDGSQYFDKGSAGPAGYYSARIPDFGSGYPCVGPGLDRPDFVPSVVTVVND